MKGSEQPSVLDVLLRIRGEFHRLSEFIGEPHVFSMNGFKLGYQICLSKRGVPEEREVHFREWLRSLDELPWYDKHLEACQGDHLAAIRKLLDRVAEFHALGEPEAPEWPKQIRWSQGAVESPLTDSVLDELLTIRRDFERLFLYIGRPHVLTMDGVIRGYTYGLKQVGLEDGAYHLFQQWLRDVKHEPPMERWHTEYLRDAQGDHLQAIRRLLDLAAEFHATQEPGRRRLDEIEPELAARQIGRFELLISQEVVGAAYLRLPTHPGTVHGGCKRVALDALMGPYKGPRVILDFNQDMVLVGIEFES